MRPAGKGPLESLYFNYPSFDAPDRSNRPNKAPVAIVGAGPVGMVAALSLARYGIRSCLFDNKATFNDGSRAICIARTSYNLFHALGVLAPFLEKSAPYLSGRNFFRGQEIFEFFNPDAASEKFRPMYNLQQQYIEQFLYDGVAASPLVDMRWQSEVKGLDEDETGLHLAVSDPNGDYTFHADWVLAADGARSMLRKLRGKKLSGDNFEGRYVIADIRMDNPVKVERFALFDPDKRPGSTVLVHQQPENIWRIDYQLRANEPEDEALSEASIRQSVQQVLDECGYDKPWELEWWSIYSANTLLMDDYRDGRVFFIGDSAHIVPIFGVRGFNNGVLDAHNIGWKLASVINGQASEALLDSYSPERRGATLDVFENASKSARFMTPPSRGYEVLRDAALSLALDFPFAGAFSNPRNMTPYAYFNSPLTARDDPGFPAGPIPGAAAPDAPHSGSFLQENFGPGFTVLAFGKVPGLDALENVTLCQLSTDSEAAKIYGATTGSAYLIRPDHFIAARWRSADGASINAAITAILKGTTP